MRGGDLALAGAILMELALAGRIDTDLDRLVVVQQRPTGDALLDGVLARLATGAAERTSRWWKGSDTKRRCGGQGMCRKKPMRFFKPGSRSCEPSGIR